MKARTDALVADYLRQLDRELVGLPRGRRREILAEIGGHIHEARAELPPDSEPELRTLLDRLGEPADIAAEARQRFDVPSGRFGFREVAALVLLPVGGIVIPFLGWFVGVILLWSSGSWTAREKLAGTLLPPGGLLVPVGLGLVADSSSGPCVESGTGGSVAVIECPQDSFGVSEGLALAVFALLALLAVAVPIWLASRLRRRTT